MAFTANSLVGAVIGDVDTTAKFPLGSVVHATDPTFGEGTFVYLKGVASTAAGSVVVFDQVAGVTTLAVAASRGAVAVATAATVASTFGWYQVRGLASTKETGATAGSKPYVTASAGIPSITVVATQAIDGMRFVGADAAGFANAQLAYPFANGNG